jgi:hypothetical protein
VPSPWSSADALKAARTLLVPGHRNQSEWMAESVELEDDDTLLVDLDIDGERFGVRYSLIDMSEGPQTGLPCDSPDQRAKDLWGDLDEEICTGAAVWAEKLEGPHGLVLLRWWPGPSDRRS